MKTTKILFSILLFCMTMATNAQVEVSNDISSTELSEPMQLTVNLYTGVYANETVGVHPHFSFSLGYGQKSNKLFLEYERRFGKSQSEYGIVENDSLIFTDKYKGQYIGLSYVQPIFTKSINPQNLSLGIGYDWLSVDEVDSPFLTEQLIDGIAFNLGYTYTHFFTAKHGIVAGLIFRFADLKNEGGTAISKQSYVLRLSYLFGGDKA